ncbi:hypothetical protein C7Y70_02290 [Pseudoalteromonas sp. KS88]|uniref:DUF3325 domain-containing protein n=1 Tax=Pseudoalteromonas sp. KS88 TaxID=2109918 RepID=UPI001081395D|nr:DUF3325 domain-containing protein [Pseudoalteromonas sp. KS88]TGE85560.1 hypothetical protein C7Y70_02290 [Pseudoalteromonas sp. KS88]
MLILLQIMLQLVGFTLLSLSLQRYYNHVFSQALGLKKSTCILCRCAGFALLIVAAIHAISLWGNSLGLVYVFATATLITTLLAVLLAYITYKSKDNRQIN